MERSSVHSQFPCTGGEGEAVAAWNECEDSDKKMVVVGYG